MRSPDRATKERPPDTKQSGHDAAGTRLLLATGLMFLLVVSPVVLRGAPLADDFHTCLRPVQDGSFTPFLQDSWRELGVVRPARFLEIALIGGFCQRAPFGLLIAVPLLLTLTVAALLRGLLRDLQAPAPWPAVGAALWLLQPLGTEAALWPSALHVPLGLALVLGALRLYRRGRLLSGTAVALAASLSVEQVIFALPLAVWLVTGEQRRRATASASALVIAVLAAYATWPGEDLRTAVTPLERMSALLEDPTWYVVFPAVGTGVHSGVLAVAWATPGSLVLVAGTALAASRVPALWGGRRTASGLRTPAVLRTTGLVLVLCVLVNLPLASTTPRGYSARTFAPTWLLLATAVAVLGARTGWRPGRVATAACAALASIALLSQALSVSVRVRTADFTEESSRWIASQVADGATVEVCDVPRTAVELAPLGAFHLHELHWEWASREAIFYYAGRDVRVERFGRYWPGDCPALPPADLSVDFAELRRQVGAR